MKFPTISYIVLQKGRGGGGRGRGRREGRREGGEERKKERKKGKKEGPSLILLPIQTKPSKKPVLGRL